MEALKKYKFFIILVLIVLIILFSFFNKPKEIESIEIVESNVEEVKNTIKFQIKGAVKKDGVYEILEDSRVIDAIKLSGGVLENADTSDINLSAKLLDAMVIDIPYQESLKGIKVDIKGEVKLPGVYELDENARIIDVIKLSGGLNEFADTSNINLSKRVFDEMVIIIPKIVLKEEIIGTENENISKDENVTNDENTIKDEIISNDEVKNEEDNIIKNDGLIGDEQNSEQKEEQEEKEDVIVENKKISLNTATKEELMTLSGIGESKALAIIEYRNNKQFETIEEITNIKGIGNSIYEKIKDNITL